MPSTDAPVHPAVPAVDRAAGVGVRALAAKLVQTSLLAERAGKPADVEVRPARAVLVDEPAVHAPQPPYLIEVFRRGQIAKQDVGYRLHEPGGMRRAPRNVHDGGRDPNVAEELPDPHAPGRVAAGGGDAPVGGAGAERHHGQGVPPQGAGPIGQRDLPHAAKAPPCAVGIAPSTTRAYAPASSTGTRSSTARAGWPNGPISVAWNTRASAFPGTISSRRRFAMWGYCAFMRDIEQPVQPAAWSHTTESLLTSGIRTGANHTRADPGRQTGRCGQPPLVPPQAHKRELR